MTGYSRRVTESLKQSVLDCYIMRYTLEQTRDYIKRVHKRSVSREMVAQYRHTLKVESREELSRLMKDDFEYHYTFMQRLEELRKLQYKQWDLYHQTDSDFVKHNCLKELHALSISLANLYHDLPMISLNKVNYRGGDIIDNPLSSSITSVFPSIPSGIVPKEQEQEQEQRQQDEPNEDDSSGSGDSSRSV